MPPRRTKRARGAEDGLTMYTRNVFPGTAKSYFADMDLRMQRNASIRVYKAPRTEPLPAPVPPPRPPAPVPILKPTVTLPPPPPSTEEKDTESYIHRAEAEHQLTAYLHWSGPRKPFLLQGVRGVGKHRVLEYVITHCSAVGGTPWFQRVHHLDSLEDWRALQLEVAQLQPRRPTVHILDIQDVSEHHVLWKDMSAWAKKHGGMCGSPWIWLAPVVSPHVQLYKLVKQEVFHLVHILQPLHVTQVRTLVMTYARGDCSVDQATQLISQTGNLHLLYQMPWLSHMVDSGGLWYAEQNHFASVHMGMSTFIKHWDGISTFVGRLDNLVLHHFVTDRGSAQWLETWEQIWDHRVDAAYSSSRAMDVLVHDVEERSDFMLWAMDQRYEADQDMRHTMAMASIQQSHCQVWSKRLVHPLSHQTSMVEEPLMVRFQWDMLALHHFPSVRPVDLMDVLITLRWQDVDAILSTHGIRPPFWTKEHMAQLKVMLYQWMAHATACPLLPTCECMTSLFKPVLQKKSRYGPARR
jgi:hypothetical protein